ncbi:MAG: HEPN domain-containing protein [Chloroflexi bacterium]|nr:HEPN domain-containing protein [Chloroflexota bacterium]
MYYTFTKMRRGSLDYLTPEERRVLDKFVEVLKREGNGQILLAALFGSKARGEATEDSDIDVLIVADSATDEFRQHLRTISPVFIEDALVNKFIFGREQWADYAKRRAVWWQNIQRDGVLLLRAPTLPDTLTIFADFNEENLMADHRPEVKNFMSLAREALSDAEVNMEGRHYRTVGNRGYYAVFYAANAMLATLGLQRSKHSGVQSTFREKFVKTKIIEDAYSDDYGKTMEIRETIDYDAMFTNVEPAARESLEKSRHFVERIEKYLKEKGYLEE